MNDEPEIPKAASRNFQIHEEDLAALERDLPDLMHAHAADQQQWEKDIWKRVIETIKNVRWCYGPWLECHQVEGELPEPKEDDPADWWKGKDDTELE